MKITVHLPDNLFFAVRRCASEDRSTVRAMVERALRAQLRTTRGRAPRAGQTSIKWVIVDGGLPAGLDSCDRAAMHDRFRGER